MCSSPVDSLVLPSVCGSRHYSGAGGNWVWEAGW